MTTTCFSKSYAYTSEGAVACGIRGEYWMLGYFESDEAECRTDPESDDETVNAAEGAGDVAYTTGVCVSATSPSVNKAADELDLQQ